MPYHEFLLCCEQVSCWLQLLLIAVSGDVTLCTFFHNFFAQLVSAQKLSALFPLRKFSSVANLKYKFLDWHIYKDLKIDKNRYYENVWNWFLPLFHFLRRFRKFVYFYARSKQIFRTISKNETRVKTNSIHFHSTCFYQNLDLNIYANSEICIFLHNFFFLRNYSTDFQKKNFLTFLFHYPQKSEIVV